MRFLSSLILAAAALTLHAAAPAQTAATAAFPSQPLRLVVPVPAGGPSDFIARQVAQHLGTALGQPVVVENEPGANGLLAARDGAAAPADGHTLVYAPGSMIATPLLSKGVSFDWARDLAPLGKVGRVPFALAVHPGVPAQTVAELVRHARQNPGALNVATSTPSEVMAAARFMKATATTLTRVPYKGGAQALPDLLAGRVHVMFGPLSLLQPQAKAGAVRLLATLTPERNAAVPDLPTAAEAGVPALDVPTWQGIFTAAQVPAATRARLAAGLAAALARPEIKAEFERRLLVAEVPSEAELSATVGRELASWAALIAEYQLSAD